MPLAVIEADCLHAREAVQCPRKTCGRILTAGKENQSCFALHHSASITATRARANMLAFAAKLPQLPRAIFKGYAVP
jgi:hypothetical protein